MNYRDYESQYHPRYNNNQSYYYQQQQQDDYQRLPRMTHSSSTGTHRYSNYYPQQHQQQEEYYDYVPTRKRRNKIDRSVNLHLDGEPMNDLEVIAAKNAAKNERKSKIVYPDHDELLYQEKNSNNDSVSPSLNTMMESLSVSSLESTLVDNDTATHLKEEAQEQVMTPTATTKKKVWPFVSLFKKKPVVLAPTKSTPITTTASPPTPVLSPDGNTTSSLPSSSTCSPFEELDGMWAFTYPTVLAPMMPTVWVRFDNENQKLISDHVRSALPVVQFTDSHIGGARVPITVIPSQMACFIPMANQLSRLELNYIPSHLAHQ